MCSTCHGTIVAERNRTDDHNLGPNSDGVYHILSWEFHIVCFGNYISVRPGSRSFLATIRDLLGIKTITLFKVMLWVPGRKEIQDPQDPENGPQDTQNET